MGFVIFATTIIRMLNQIGIQMERVLVKFKPLIDKIKYEGRNKDHDCVIGISGGFRQFICSLYCKS